MNTKLLIENLSNLKSLFGFEVETVNNGDGCLEFTFSKSKIEFTIFVDDSGLEFGNILSLSFDSASDFRSFCMVIEHIKTLIK